MLTDHDISNVSVSAIDNSMSILLSSNVALKNKQKENIINNFFIYYF